MRAFSCVSVKTGDRLLPLDAPSYRAFVATIGEGEEVLVEFADPTGEIPKTRQQEKGLHAMIAPWAKAEGHRVDDLKRDLLREVFGEQEHLNPITHEVSMVLREPHTSTLTKAQYSDLIERTLQIGAECGHVLIAPDEWRRMHAAEGAPQQDETRDGPAAGAVLEAV